MQWVWLFEYDFLFLAIGFGCIAFVAGRNATTENCVTRRMRILLWVIVVFSTIKVLIFLFFSKGTFIVSAILSGITGIILIPAFLVWLGCGLTRMTSSELTSALYPNFGGSGGGYGTSSALTGL